MEHLRVTHGIGGSSVTCTICDTVWQLPQDAPMVATLDLFANAHMGCTVTRRPAPVRDLSGASY
jgi:hypothetical protein